ncbi:MAG: 16S rRNA (cytosine(1402)-N(4))-methyltransferase RsmH [Candidatus Moranbacteria bacterium]|nr:16S rRNA (cytosine(1402)-N(4))-methyltransferase RsmH [Candidatus Moranbacteria bacterium]
MKKSAKHIPVLLQEALDSISIKPKDIVVDATLGGGGYSREILRKNMPGGILIAIDRDPDAIEAFRKALSQEEEFNNLEEGKDFYLICDNYSHLTEILGELGIKKVQSIVADLGISSDQLADLKKGLSFSLDALLDMRLNSTESIKTASHIVNHWNKENLIRLLRDNAQESNALSIVNAILEARKKAVIRTTKELADIIERLSNGKRGKIHPATKTFQALRIEVNAEKEHLKFFLNASIEKLESYGRLAVVSFHSGEDREVKRIFRTNARGCICPDGFPLCRCGYTPRIKIIQKKPLCPSEKEIQENPRARSAKLRVIEKLKS